MGNNSAIWWVLGIVVLVVLILIGISLAKRSRSKAGGPAPAGSTFAASGRSGNGPGDLRGEAGTTNADRGEAGTTNADRGEAGTTDAGRGEAGRSDAGQGDRSRVGTAGVAAAGAGAAGVAGAAASTSRDDAPPEGETDGTQDRSSADSRGDTSGTASDDRPGMGAGETAPSDETASDTSAEAARPYAPQPGSASEDPDRAFFGDDDDVRPVDSSDPAATPAGDAADRSDAPTQALPVTTAPGAQAGDGEEPPLYAATEDDRSEAPTQAIPTSESPGAAEGSAGEDWVVEESVVIEEPAVNDPHRQPGQNRPPTDEDGAATARSDQGAGSPGGGSESDLSEQSGYGGAARGGGDVPAAGDSADGDDTVTEESTSETVAGEPSDRTPYRQESAADRQGADQRESEIEETAAAPDGVEPGLGREAAEVRSLDSSDIANGDESTTAAVPSDVPAMPGDAAQTPTDATPPRAPVGGDPGDPAPGLDERAEELAGSDARQAPSGTAPADRDAGLANSIGSDGPIGVADPTGSADPVGGSDQGARSSGAPAYDPPPGTGAADPAWAGAEGPQSEGPGAGGVAAGGAAGGGAAAAAQRLREQAKERWTQPGKSGESPSGKLGHLRDQAKERWTQPGKSAESPSGKFGHLRERVEGEVRTRMQNRPSGPGATDQGPIQSGPTGQNAPGQSPSQGGPGQSGGQSGSGLRGRVEGEVRHRVEDGIRRFRNRGGSSSSGQ